MVILVRTIQEEKRIKQYINNLRVWATALDIRIERGEKAIEKVVLFQKKGLLRGVNKYMEEVGTAINASESLLRVMRTELTEIVGLINKVYARLEKLKSFAYKPAGKKPKIV